MNLDAILRIGTKVTGVEQISQLQGKFKAVEGAAQSMASRSGLLSNALGAVVPAVTIGGLGALIGKTIEAGDALNDMSQRTGVSVEALAKFKKAAATSGTDIEAVSKSLVKLDRGLFNIGGKGDRVGPALDRMGISARDAAGHLKSADQITLEVANRFKAMPDGVEKTATALDLFGKAGADMIPMLNMGGQAIDSLSIKMTTAFAQKADQYNDKLAMLSGKVGGLAAGLTMALLPALELVVDGLTAVVNVIDKLPGPVQTIIGLFAGLAVAVTAMAPALSLLAGTGLWTTITTAFTGFLTFMSTIFVPGLLAFFSGPVGWITLAVIAVGAMVYAFREPIGKFLAWMGEQLSGLGKSISDWLIGIGKTVYGAVDTVNKTIQTGLRAAWDWVTKSIGNVASALAQPFEIAANAIKSVLRSVLTFGAQVINGFLGAINQMITAVNGVAARLRLPQLPTFGSVSVPSFAGGGYTGNAPRSGGLDGQGGFMAMLHPRETVVDHAGTGAGGGVPNITIQTGQVLQMPDGSQWVSMADLEQAMRATAAGVLGQLRTPAGRVAMGGV